MTLEELENEIQMSEKKPPLGVKPKSLLESERARELMAAIARYLEAGEHIPQEWVKELIPLLRRL